MVVVNSSMTEENVMLRCNLWNIESYYIKEITSDINGLIHYIAMGIFICVVILFTLLLNGVAMVTIMKSCQFYNKPCYFVIFVQSCIDFSSGVIAMPLSLVFIVDSFIETPNCFITTLAYIMLISSYELSLICYVALTWERYIAILQPYSYTTKVTKRKLMISLGFAYLLDLPTSATLFVFSQMYFLYIRITKLMIFFSLFLYTYTRIYIVIRKISRRTNSVDSSQGSISRSKLFLQQVKLARSCFFAVACFLVFMILPMVTIFAFSSVLEYGGPELQLLSSWMIYVSFTNSIVNSIIFFWSKALLRKEAFRLLKFPLPLE